MKAAGYRAGFPDLFIYEPRGEFHGLAIEMKRDKKSRVSESQKEWIEALNERGFRGVVCYGFDDAVSVIDSYFHRSTN